MSTNKTPNLNLHSWTPDDPFRRAEFNDNFKAIDENAGKTWDELTAKADAATLSALQNTVSAGLEARPRMLFGTYTGDGDATQTISLGVTPKVVMVWCQGIWQGTDDTWFGGCAIEGYTMPSRTVELTDNGFSVHWFSGAKQPWSNSKGTAYVYVAWY